MATEYKTFSFVSGKGGVGKTLIAINAACELSAYSNVLLIDFDLFNYGLTLHFKQTIQNFNTQQRSILTLYGLMEYFDPSSQYDLRLMSVATIDKLVDEGHSLVIVALVSTDLHIRIFDANGEKVVDKAEKELISGKTLTALKQRLNPFPEKSSLSQEDKQEFVRNATSIACHTLSTDATQNAVRKEKVTKIIRDRGRRFCTIENQNGVSRKIIHFLPCFVPFSGGQVNSNAEILRAGGHWSKVTAFVDLLNDIIPTLVEETKSQFVLFDCHPGLVVFSSACCAVSNCNILISDFDDSTILSSIIFSAFVKQQTASWEPSKTAGWGIVINRVPSANEFSNIGSKIGNALDTALDTDAVKALSHEIWDSIERNLRHQALAKIPDLEELRDPRIYKEEKLSELSPARRGGNGLILSVKSMLRNRVCKYFCVNGC